MPSSVCNTMANVFRASPYPLLSLIFHGMVFLITTFGMYFVVNRMDRKISESTSRTATGSRSGLSGRY